MNIRALIKKSFNRFADVRIEMNRIDNLNIFTFAEFEEGCADILKSGTKIFPSVSGYEDQPPSVIQNW